MVVHADTQPIGLRHQLPGLAYVGLAGLGTPRGMIVSDKHAPRIERESPTEQDARRHLNLAFRPIRHDFFRDHETGAIGHDRYHSFTAQSAHSVHEIAVERAAIAAQRRLNHLFSRAVMQQLPDSKKRLDPVFAVESTLTQVRFAGVGQGADRSEPFQQAFRKLPGIRAERREQTGQMVRSIRDRR